MEENEYKHFNPTPELGLSTIQVQQRIEEGITNEPVESPSKTIKEIVLTNVCTYFNFIFAVIAGFLIFVGSFKNISFLPVIIANTAIGIVQEIRAKKTLDKLSLLNEPKAVVVRDGRIYDVNARDLVMDDVVIFRSGNQICADAIVLDGAVNVNESLITGEADEIRKMPGDTLLSGSFIVSGECRARLDKVGADSYASKLTLMAKEQKQGEQSEMIKALNRILVFVGIAIIPISLIMFIQQYNYCDASLKESVTSTAAAIIGMIPEGLYLLTSVALAVSVVRLASRKVLVHDMKCIETLARVDVLCVDKTGTITENEMHVTEVVKLYNGNEYNIEAMLNDFTANMPRDNKTMEAMAEYFTTPGGARPDSITTFSSATKYSSETYNGVAYVLGAPEFVLRSQYAQYKDTIEEYGKMGGRVIVFARYDGIIDGKALTESVLPLALIVIQNPIRKEARATFEYFEKQGVSIKVISGDNPVTVSCVAKNAGITGAENYIDAQTLTNEYEIMEAMDRYTVFGRVTPDQKRAFVSALKATGHTVAMTGDGVNVFFELMDGYCCVARASGSVVASQASEIVLLDSDFSCLPDVVLEGRRVVNNIERSASLFLVKNIFSICTAIFAMIFMITYPLQPSQISLISAFTIGIPGFLLAFENNTNRIKGSFISNVLFNALPGGLTDAIAVCSLVIFGRVFNVSAEDIATASTILLAVVGFMIVFKVSYPVNKWRGMILVSMVIGLIVSMRYAGELFDIASISIRCTMLLVVFAIASEALFRYLGMLCHKLREIYRKMLDKAHHKVK
ncbi:MAG: cation-translocating P-type ATPase [Lachnospiraceae bacterium]|nr:cation-translocating P-type ATPase [Lachnospiraceae bacterium]